MSLGAALRESLASALVMKVVSFAISVLTVRWSSLAEYGKVTVNFRLIVSLSLFLLKEGCRRAALRADTVKRGRAIVFIGIVFTCLVAIPGIILAYARMIDSHEDQAVLAVIGAALIVEAIAELALFEHAAVAGNLGVRNRADTLANLVRSLVILAMLMMGFSGTLSYTVSKFCDSCVLAIVAFNGVHTVIPSLGSILPTLKDKAITIPLMEMSVMSFQKLFLTEGERMLSLGFFSPDEIGLLGMVSNLGSIVLRLLFAPIEDIAFTALSRTKNRPERRRVLQSVLFIEAAFGLLALTFGPPVSHSALLVMYGSRWSGTTAVPLLQVYCGMILLFALNGCFEAYYFAVADSRQIRLSLVAQWVAFALFGGTTWALAAYGPIAILIGNAVSMVARIAWTFTVFDSWSEPVHPLLSFIIKRILIGATIAVAALRLVHFGTFISSSVHVAVAQLAMAGAVGMATLASIFRPIKLVLSDVKSD